MTAIAERSFPSVSVILRISSIIGRSVWECVFLKLTEYSANTASSVTTATEATGPELSIAKIFIRSPYSIVILL